MAKTALYFITGSSGSGKTTLLKGVVGSSFPALDAHHFDDLGMPSLEEMNAGGGDPAEWQAIQVRRWIETLAQQDGAGLVVLEGQARPTVILAAAKQAGFSAARICLIDCSHEERRRRLVQDRAQPELDRLDMYAWAAYLRGQADALGLEIIDTTLLSAQEATLKLAASIRRFAEETGSGLD